MHVCNMYITCCSLLVIQAAQLSELNKVSAAFFTLLCEIDTRYTEHPYIHNYICKYTYMHITLAYVYNFLA